MNHTILELIKDNVVDFNSFRQGMFYYIIKDFKKKDEHEDLYDYYDPKSERRYNRYLFPVPLEDIGTATMESRDKAITFMRWIRKSIEDKTFIKI